MPPANSLLVYLFLWQHSRGLCSMRIMVVVSLGLSVSQLYAFLKTVRVRDDKIFTN